MFRTAFIILLALPMLMPPGFCVCRLGAFAVRKADRVSEPAAAARQTETTTTCNCGSPNCRHRRPTAQPVQNRDSPAKEQVPHRSPEPDHAPGCPAHPAYAISRAFSIELPTHLAELFPGGLVLASPAPSVPDVLDGSPAASEVLPPPAPLFLLCCAFRC